MLAFGRGRSVAVRIPTQFFSVWKICIKNAFRWFESGYRPENRTEGKPSVQKCIYKMELSRYVQSKKSPKSEKPRYLHLFTGVRGVAPNGGKQMRRAAWSGYGRCVRFRPLPVCDRR